jgi:hypothetical protein
MAATFMQALLAIDDVPYHRYTVNHLQIWSDTSREMPRMSKKLLGVLRNCSTQAIPTTTSTATGMHKTATCHLQRPSTAQMP